MHKKLYKAGKVWVAMAVVAATAIIGANVASADTTTNTSSAEVVAQSQAQQTAANASSASSVQNDSTSQSQSSSSQSAASSAAQSSSTQDTSAQNDQPATGKSARDTALDKYASEHVTGYIYSPDVSTANGGYNWFENGQLYTGFRYYMGTYYWFVDGVRQNAGWRQAWGMTYYTDDAGRAVQGHRNINGQDFYFGDNGTYYLRSTGYLYDGSSQNGGYRWYENGRLYTGFRYYMGTYY